MGLRVIFDQTLFQSYTKCFYDELNSSAVELTTEIEKSAEFLHAHFSTFKAVLFQSKERKSDFFARLFKSGLISGQLSIADEYDDI